MHHRFVSILALLLVLVAGSAGAASAATGSGGELPASGFLTLSNQETGQQVAVWCRAGRADSIAVVDRTSESYVVSPPLGTTCTPGAFPGFHPVVNLDPRDGGWVIAAPGYGRQMAYACTRDGAAFAIGRPDAEFYVFLREGYCGPGMAPA